MRSGIPLFLAALFLLLPACSEKEEASTTTVEEVVSTAVPVSTTAPSPGGTFAKSSECSVCHEDAHKQWEHSHHALAHRDTGGPLDVEPFADIDLTLDDAVWKFSGGKDKPRIAWSDKVATNVAAIDQTPPMAIGFDPLVQYILDIGDGRFQVPDMAWDTEKKEWFSIYGDQNRRPHEWGHWTRRGMNWNSQCAYCHFTNFHKNHDSETDIYTTTWVEQGVGCSQCHGPNRAHQGEDQCLIDPKQKYSKEQWTSSCSTCHARREELDENFVIGDSFFDHYGLSLPSQPMLWYADGQQLDEIYKTTSLLLSKMGHKGIGCLDCHDPHAAEPIGGDLSVRANALCLTCHAGGANEATVIDPLTHSFHEYGTEGSTCVDCHMPKTPYMGRDPRSDHRFPSPDPLITKELGIPNACNNCHEDKGLDWQIEWTDKWYGEKMKTPARTRTRAVHAAQNGKTGALDQLISVFDVEEIDAWRATLLRLMAPWAADSRVIQRANQAAGDGGPTARSAAAFLIATRGDSGPMLDKVLNDPLKSVRVQAAWIAFERLPAEHPAVKEVEQVALHQSDQPGGAMRMARIAMTRGNVPDAEKWFKRAAAWDSSSAAPRRDFAIFLGGLGRTAESVKWLEEAAVLAPNNPEIPYLAALAYAENGDQASAEARLKDAVAIAPGFGRAWYNLGLLQASQQKLPAAINSLRRAGAADLTNPDPPYARATVHLRIGQVTEAAAAAREALLRAPDHAPAQQFLDQLSR